MEVVAMRKAMSEFKNIKMSLIVVCVNKKTNVKLYYNISNNSNDLTKVKSS